MVMDAFQPWWESASTALLGADIAVKVALGLLLGTVITSHYHWYQLHLMSKRSAAQTLRDDKNEAIVTLYTTAAPQPASTYQEITTATAKPIAGTGIGKTTTLSHLSQASILPSSSSSSSSSAKVHSSFLQPAVSEIATTSVPCIKSYVERGMLIGLGRQWSRGNDKTILSEPQLQRALDAYRRLIAIERNGENRRFAAERNMRVAVLAGLLSYVAYSGYHGDMWILGRFLWRHSLATVAVCSVVSVPLIIYTVVPKMVYIGAAVLPRVPQPLPNLPGAERVLICGNKALFVPAQSDELATRPTIICFHGNAMFTESFFMEIPSTGNAALMGDLSFPNGAFLSRDCGCNVLSVEYPAYLDNENRESPSLLAIRDIAEGALFWVKSRLPDSPVVTLGISLGGAVAADLTAHHQAEIRGIIIINSFESIPHMMSDVLFQLTKWRVSPNLLGFLTSETWDSAGCLRRLSADMANADRNVTSSIVLPGILLLSSDHDEVVHPKHMTALRKSCHPKSFEFFSQPGRHMVFSSRTWQSRLQSFLSHVR